MDYSQQALTALNVYLSRSLALLERLKDSAWSDIEHLLRLKTAAFHNFRAVDALLISRGIDVAGVEAIQETWRQIAQVDNELEQRLADYRDELREDLQRSQRLRQSIRKYRSGVNARSIFVTEV